MREIDVLKKLRQCEYVVHLYHVQVCVLVVGVVNGCHGNRICNELMRLWWWWSCVSVTWTISLKWSHFVIRTWLFFSINLVRDLTPTHFIKVYHMVTGDNDNEYCYYCYCSYCWWFSRLWICFLILIKNLKGQRQLQPITLLLQCYSTCMSHVRHMYVTCMSHVCHMCNVC